MYMYVYSEWPNCDDASRLRCVAQSISLSNQPISMSNRYAAYTSRDLPEHYRMPWYTAYAYAYA